MDHLDKKNFVGVFKTTNKSSEKNKKQKFESMIFENKIGMAVEFEKTVTDTNPTYTNSLFDSDGKEDFWDKIDIIFKYYKDKNVSHLRHSRFLELVKVSRDKKKKVLADAEKEVRDAEKEVRDTERKEIVNEIVNEVMSVLKRDEQKNPNPVDFKINLAKK